MKNEAFPTWFGPFVELEERATRIHTWDQRLVPGLLQTEDYARAVMRMTRPGEAPEVIERDVAARLERQAIMARERPPRLWFVIDEAALRRPLGSREVARGQLKHLLDVAELPFAVIQVLPLAVSEHPGADGSLIVLEFAGRPPVAYAEGWRTGRMIESAAEVEDAVVVFDLIRAAALSRGSSLELIRTIEEEL